MVAADPLPFAGPLAFDFCHLARSHRCLPLHIYDSPQSQARQAPRCQSRQTETWYASGEKLSSGESGAERAVSVEATAAVDRQYFDGLLQ